MEDSPLEFARLSWLAAGPVLCVLLVLLLRYSDRKKQAALARLVHPRFRDRLMPGHSPKRLWIKRSLWLLALLLLCTAAAGPRKGFEWREVKRRGIDILFAVDTSRSMLAEDLQPNRLERARMGIHDFVDRLKGDRIGLVPFAGSSYALCPLTLDYDAFRESLNALDTDLIPRQGTDVASAIREADRLFDEQGHNHRILVLITDGEDLQGDALEAADDARKKGMTIYPVGVGSTDGVTIPLRLANGVVDQVRDDAGNPVRTKLDEDSLRKIATATGGFYAALGRGAEGLDLIYREKLRLVPQNEMDSRMERIPFERFEWPLAAAILLLMMEFLLPDRRRPAKTRALPSAARRHRVPATLLIALTGLAFLRAVPSLMAAEDPRVLYNQGTEAYETKDYPRALDRFSASLNTPDLKLQTRAYYNLGNTRYRLGQASLNEKPEETIKVWEESIKAYNDVLSLDSTDEDARFNLALVTKKLEELKKQQEKKDEGKKDGDKKEQKDEEKKDQEKKDGQSGGQKQEGGEKEKDQSKSNDEAGGSKDSPDKKEDGSKEGDQKDAGQSGDSPSDKDKEGDPTGKMKEEGDKDNKEQPSGSEGKDQKEGAEEKEKQAAGKQDKDGKTAEEKQAQEQKDGTGKKEEGTKEAAEKSGEGDAKTGDPDKKEEKAMSITEERRKPGEMSREEARQLLQTLRSDERTVIPFQRPQQRGRFRDPNNTVKGKTW